MGPFNGLGVEFKYCPGYHSGRITVGESEAKVLKAVGQCGVLSRYLISVLTGCAARTLKRLMAKGYLDQYTSDRCPPVYSLGKKGAEILNVRHRIWDSTWLLRTVAANQLWAQMTRIWPNSTWDTTGDYPVLSREGASYMVAAPRLAEKDKIYALRAANLAGRNPLLVVAATQVQALDLARSVHKETVRYTWDELMKDGILFYHLSSGILKLDSEFESKKYKENVDKEVFYVLK